jgi:enoyl-CoA hydratase/carnithine racemase
MTPTSPPNLDITSEIIAEIIGQVGFITLNRPAALNALSLGMIRSITQTLHAWRDDDAVQAVAMRGVSKAGPFGAFCAGGDIRFFHQAAIAGDAALEDFFTEEYALNHFVHNYPKPTIAFMDGIVMGGGMGLAQGMSMRIVTEHTKMAMPETQIGLFPDVGGGYFLSRCPGHIGEWLGLTGEMVAPNDAVAFGLADAVVDSQSMPAMWQALGSLTNPDKAALQSLINSNSVANKDHSARARGLIDPIFSKNSLAEIINALQADPSTWAQETLTRLRHKSPLMLHVTLEQIRRARSMTLAQDLRMERDLVHHCFNPKHLNKTPAQSETVEGIRAQAIDKDRTPRWSPASIEEVIDAMVKPFFASPWAAGAHPLRALQ